LEPAVGEGGAATVVALVILGDEGAAAASVFVFFAGEPASGAPSSRDLSLLEVAEASVTFFSGAGEAFLPLELGAESVSLDLGGVVI